MATKYMTDVEAEQYLDSKIKATTLRQWRSMGKGPAFIRLGERGAGFYTTKHLDDYFNEHVVVPERTQKG